MCMNCLVTYINGIRQCQHKPELDSLRNRNELPVHVLVWFVRKSLGVTAMIFQHAKIGKRVAYRDTLLKLHYMLNALNIMLLPLPIKRLAKGCHVPLYLDGSHRMLHILIHTPTSSSSSLQSSAYAVLQADVYLTPAVQTIVSAILQV